MPERVHRLGRAVAWTCGKSGGRECRRYASTEDAMQAAHRLRAHIAKGRWTGVATMRAVAMGEPRITDDD
jgi:hypothetical protein